MLGFDELIPLMRGETSEPLIAELQKILKQALNNEYERASVQVDSSMVNRGLTLVLNLNSLPRLTASIVLSRLEIPGFFPNDTNRMLQELDWSVFNDRYGQKYVVITRTFTRFDLESTAGELSLALELLGAPQKHAWRLEAFYE